MLYENGTHPRAGRYQFLWSVCIASSLDHPVCSVCVCVCVWGRWGWGGGGGGGGYICEQGRGTEVRDITFHLPYSLVVIMHMMSGDQWHLRKTNWCGEATDILDDEVTRLIRVLSVVAPA